jgi:hypothetical protein
MTTASKSKCPETSEFAIATADVSTPILLPDPPIRGGTVGLLNPVLGQYIDDEHTSGFIARFRKRHGSVGPEHWMARSVGTRSTLGDALPE